MKLDISSYVGASKSRKESSQCSLLPLLGMGNPSIAPNRGGERDVAKEKTILTQFKANTGSSQTTQVLQLVKAKP